MRSEFVFRGGYGELLTQRTGDVLIMQVDGAMGFRDEVVDDSKIEEVSFPSTEELRKRGRDVVKPAVGR